MIRLLGCSILLSALSMVNPAGALEFETRDWSGHRVLHVTGDIQEGDAAQFSKHLASAPSLPHGLPVVLLDSGGGSVAEALQISDLFRAKPVHTVIPDGAMCASACASILFVAGTLRTVEQGGLLGQHSCSSLGVQNDACNEVIANHAISHGVSHGSIAAFVTYAPPEDMIWFSRQDADCWGITRYAFEPESGFEKSEPCPIRMITGRAPAAQSAWRVDFLRNGYRAFLRPASDHERELQLNIFCDESTPGTLYVGMEIGGPAGDIASAVREVTVDAEPIFLRTTEFDVEQVDEVYSQLIVALPSRDVVPLLTQANEFKLDLDLREPYQPIGAKTYLSSSRKALLFAANHCMQ